MMTPPAEQRPSATERPTLIATRRPIAGTRAVSRLRRGGMIPAIVYGKAVEPLLLMVNTRDLIKFLHAHVGEHGLLTLRVEADPAPLTAGSSRTGKADGASWEKPVLIKRVAHDPVNGGILHVDFHAIALTEQIRIKIPIVLNGVPVGVKQDGGLLEHFLREIEVACLPTAIPKQVEHDVSALKIGATIHVRELIAPPGSRITSDPEGVVASVLMPKEEKPAEAAAEALTEPEVIREKKPEAEEAAEGKEEKKAEKKEDK